jgi:mannan endo-1,4-beta-mannosidase
VERRVLVMRRAAVVAAAVVGAVLLVALVVGLNDMERVEAPETTTDQADDADTGPSATGSDEGASAADAPSNGGAGDATDPDTSDDERDRGVPARPTPLLEVGVAVADLEGLDEWIDAVGVTPDVMDSYVAWDDNPDFDVDLAEGLAERGVTLKVTWEPWIAEGGVDQPRYALSSIIDGEHDPYLRRWAEQIGDHEHPVILRLMHEMNGGWYPWGAGVNGNAEGEYVAAWQHVREVFDDVGTTNVTWEWAPNQLFEGTASLEPLYPGDEHVDRIGISAYNWGEEYEAYHRWRSFPELMAETVELIRSFAAGPIGVAETASSAVGGDKAAWIEEMFSHALAEDYEFLTYFNLDTHRDWSVDGDEQVVDAFAAGFEETRAAESDMTGR